MEDSREAEYAACQLPYKTWSTPPASSRTKHGVRRLPAPVQNMEHAAGQRPYKNKNSNLQPKLTIHHWRLRYKHSPLYRPTSHPAVPRIIEALFYACYYV